MKDLTEFLLGLLLLALIIILPTMFIGSLYTSTVKAFSGNCNYVLSIEGFFINGNWFCPTKGE